MRKVTSTRAKSNFADVLIESQKAPVVIEKHNKPHAVMISFEAFQEYQSVVKSDHYWGELAKESGRMAGKKKSADFFETFGE